MRKMIFLGAALAALVSGLLSPAYADCNPGLVGPASPCYNDRGDYTGTISSVLGRGGGGRFTPAGGSYRSGGSGGYGFQRGYGRRMLVAHHYTIRYPVNSTSVATGYVSEGIVRRGAACYRGTVRCSCSPRRIAVRRTPVKSSCHSCAGNNAQVNPQANFRVNGNNNVVTVIQTGAASAGSSGSVNASGAMAFDHVVVKSLGRQGDKFGSVDNLGATVWTSKEHAVGDKFRVANGTMYWNDKN